MSRSGKLAGETREWGASANCGLLARSAQSVRKACHILGKVERRARMISAWTFIVLGVFFILRHVFEIFG